MGEAPDIQVDDQIAALISGQKRYNHEAMNTTFQIIFPPEFEKTKVENICAACFQLVDSLEQLLSKFIPNSDVSRIVDLDANEEEMVSFETLDLLNIAQEMYHKTEGCFDLTMSELMLLWLDDHKQLKKPPPELVAAAKVRSGLDKLVILEDDIAVKVLVDQLQLDFGAIGKGYAVDQMVAMLQEYGIDCALVHGGFSTFYGFGQPADFVGWPLSFSHPKTNKLLGKVTLQNEAFSASGLTEGFHIIDPRKGEPVKSRVASWAIAKNATESDALSTTFMIMDKTDIETYCKQAPAATAVVLEKNKDEPHQLGDSTAIELV